MKFEQLDLFSDVNRSDSKLRFSGSLQDENWKTKTHTVNGAKGIVMDGSKELTKKELKNICRSAVNIIRKTYGFTIQYVESGVNKEIFVRFINETTKAKIDVLTFIDIYFDDYVEFEKKVKEDSIWK